MARFILILTVFLVFACNKKEKPPAGILSEEEMVRQITELYVLEDKIIQLGVPVDSGAKIFNVLSDKLARKTGIPDSVFRNSFRYYASDPPRMERIYSALVDSLNLKEQRSTLANP